MNPLIARAIEDELIKLKEALARVTAERNALVRHIEQLIAPVTTQETDAALLSVRNRLHLTEGQRHELRSALDFLIVERQRKGQFAALS